MLAEKAHMGKEKQGVIVVLGNQNPFAKLMTCCKEFETHFKNWFIKHSWEDAVASLHTTGLTSAVTWTLCREYEHCDSLYPRAPTLTNIFGGWPMDWACKAGVINGLHKGISLRINRVRGKEDVQTELMAGFGAGVMASLLYGTKGTIAISNGVFCALLYGGIFKVKEKFIQLDEILSESRVEYHKTRNMLSSLGLEQYEQNFRNGLVTDKTLTLINDSDLKELEIPVGARRLILDHIQRENEAKKECTSREI